MKNKKDLMVMLKETGILFAITLIAGLVLGFVYELTAEPRREQQERKIREACRSVFAEADDFAQLDVAVTGDQQESFKQLGARIGTVYEALDQKKDRLGYVIQVVSTEGYGGNIGLYLGIQMDGTLNGISILEISETPGLGMEAEDVLVPQFAEKQVSAFTYTKTGAQDETQIDAISGATVTTEAVTNGVNAGLQFFRESLQEGGARDE